METKHYFIGSKRIASRIGSGHFNNVYGMNGCNITAGQQDYAERLNQIESQKEDYYRELGIAPGVPTMKGSYGDPENTGIGYNTIIRNLGDHSVPAEWAEYVKKNEQEETVPGAPIAWESPSQPEEVQPGYGYVADNNESEETFYYHSDNLGSTSYITDDSARITQYTAYLPYGELLVDEHSSSEDLPYKFNGKELDEETGLYYYGARYMQPVASIWYGIDPLTEKYPDVSAYVYCAGNPVKLVDCDGRSTWVADIGKGKYKVIGGDLKDGDRNIYVYTKDKYGRYTKKGESIGITTSTTTFYDSDINAWAVNSVINNNDRSGKDFLNMIIGEKVTLDEYMNKARTDHPWDFKVTNGTPSVIDKSHKYKYRGMPIGKDVMGRNLYSSARDIGNMAAGMVAAKNGISWPDARIAFDAYQVKNNIDKNGFSLEQIQMEGISTRNAEYYGWSQVHRISWGKTECENIKSTIKSIIKRIFK
ncbi:MAG: RHS repeat-associated core domain-containing protein [Bacteroidaceae bacterium]|nr:RHS repeat-associated core domain-containing protein [Bacteroidaceae bacterium]